MRKRKGKSARPGQGGKIGEPGHNTRRRVLHADRRPTEGGSGISIRSLTLQAPNDGKSWIKRQGHCKKDRLEHEGARGNPYPKTKPSKKVV